MSLRIIEHADGHYQLFDSTDEIGRVTGRAIGFHGFENQAAARRAATSAWDALVRWAARQRRADPAPRRSRLLEVRQDGVRRTLALGGESVGRLLAPHETDYSDESHGFELIIPSHWGSALSAAQVVHHAVNRRLQTPVPLE